MCLELGPKTLLREFWLAGASSGTDDVGFVSKTELDSAVATRINCWPKEAQLS